MVLTSVGGLIALLHDSSPDMKSFALQKLESIVDQFSAEIFESLGIIESIFRVEQNKLAALLVSKVFFHLGFYDDALVYALHADELFTMADSSGNSDSREFTETIIAKCIDKYTEWKVSDLKCSSPAGDRDLSPEDYRKLEVVVDRMFDRCLDAKEYRSAFGIALETRRFDILKKTLELADDRDDMLRYAFRVILTLIDSGQLRNELLDILVSTYKATDAINLCQCLVLMDKHQVTADTIEALLLGSPEGVITAYQIAFDLYENSTQVFLQRVMTALTRSPNFAPLVNAIEREKSVDMNKKTFAASSDQAVDETTKASADSNTAFAKPMDVVTSNLEQPPTTSTLIDQEQIHTTESEDANAITAPAAVQPLSDEEKENKSRLEYLLNILSGDKVIELHLQFLIRNNRANLRLLDRFRLESRQSVTHNATVLANGLMHCGTTSDQFLRDNLNWLGKAVNWAKFSATATLGVIHRGHEKKALTLMSAYLPKDASGSSGSMYTEGGGLFALGLIHANHGGTMTDYLLNQCREATTDPVRHGACLGLGLAAMGTGRSDVYEQMYKHLQQDDAITSEAASIGIGLVMLGTGSEQAVNALLDHATQTTHEKIIRGIALGIALIMYGRLEEADKLIDVLVTHNDAILRWAGMATIAMAYCGTGNNRAVQRLLHTAVSDTNDDVRRWAMTALGFVLFKTPDQVPSLVSLLSESYHPHLRFGAAMAVGIACAGTAMKEALALLEKLYNGTVGFVRQGALIATAMVLIQQNGVTCPKSVEFREKCLKIVSDQHGDLLVKFGAILACGILDAGGCNMTISLQTRTGNNNMVAAVGLLLFQNFWFWYPLTNFLSLALTPTSLICLNKDLKMPQLQFRSNAKPATFAYPQPYQPEKEKKREKVETAILSITAKQRKKDADRKHAQLQQKSKEVTEEKMDVDHPEETKDSKQVPPEEKKEDKEPNFILLNNPARVIPTQLRVMTLADTSRYDTIKPITHGGIILLNDRNPKEAEVFVEHVHGHGPTGERTADAANLGSTAAGVRSGSSGAAGSGLGPGGRLIHGSSIGAVIPNEKDDDEDEEEDDEEIDEEVDDDEPDDADDVEFEEDLDEHDFEQMAYADASVLSSSATHKGGTVKSGKGSHTGTKITPPEPFLYLDADTPAVAAGTSSAAPAPTTTTTASAPTPKPDEQLMDVDEPTTKKPDSQPTEKKEEEK